MSKININNIKNNNNILVVKKKLISPKKYYENKELFTYILFEKSLWSCELQIR